MSKNPLFDFIPDTDILDRKIYITSDLHGYHRNLTYGISQWPDKEKSCRKFDTLEEMNDTLVNNINADIAEEDVLIHLGDFAFGGKPNVIAFRNRIKCQRVLTLLGNHDRNIRIDKELQSLFYWVGDYLEMSYKGKFIVMCHYPITSWNNMSKGSLMMAGHTHHNLTEQLGRRIDVGVDGYDFKPLLLDEAIRLAEAKDIQRIDHHGPTTQRHY